MLYVFKNDKTKLNLRWCRHFSFLSGKSKGLQKEMRGLRLMSSFPSLHIPSSLSFRRVSHLLHSPQVPSELLTLFLAPHRACFLQVTGCSTSQPAQVKEKLVAANMEEVVFLTIFFSATQRWLLPSEIQLETHFKAIQTQGNLNFLK